jgi:Domain of unknown function (DUF4327)
MLSTLEYSIAIIKDEAEQLLHKGKIDRKQPIYTLCQFIPPREWPFVERELERNGYLLRDHIIDLLPREIWQED